VDLAVRLPRRRANIDQADKRGRLLPCAWPGMLTGRERGRDPRDGLAGDAALGQVTRRLEVLEAVEQPRVRWLAVPARAAELLVVRVGRGRRVGVQHPAHVRLVDPHAERDRRRDDAGRAV
jgi:hypothetical protein